MELLDPLPDVLEVTLAVTAAGVVVGDEVVGMVVANEKPELADVLPASANGLSASVTAAVMSDRRLERAEDEAVVVLAEEAGALDVDAAGAGVVDGVVDDVVTVEGDVVLLVFVDGVESLSVVAAGDAEAGAGAGLVLAGVVAELDSGAVVEGLDAESVASADVTAVRVAKSVDELAVDVVLVGVDVVVPVVAAAVNVNADVVTVVGVDVLAATTVGVEVDVPDDVVVLEAVLDVEAAEVPVVVEFEVDDLLFDDDWLFDLPDEFDVRIAETVEERIVPRLMVVPLRK